MKKVLLSLLTILICLSTWAVQPTKGPIVLTKPTRPTIPFPVPNPRTEPIAEVSAYQSEDAIIVTSEEVSATMIVTIYNSMGMIVASVCEFVSVGDDISIDTTELPAGAYTIYVYYDSTLYVGQFEM